MPFFARPNLDDIQFKQLSGTTLTLSGTTRISEIGSLQFQDKDTGTYIPVVISGASEQDVLKYVGGCLILAQPTSGGTSTGVYDCASPSTCTVGGMPAGSTLSGRTIADILEEILVPTLNPALISPSSSYTLYPTSPTIYEVGASVTFTGCSCFSQGSISPAYCGGPSLRSGVPTCHRYYNFNSGVPTDCVTASLCNSFVMARTITIGSNYTCSNVCYSAGLQPLDSTGGNYDSPLPIGSTAFAPRTVTGVNPWFWGSSATTPATGQTLIDSYTCKCVANSTGTIYVDNFNVTDEYIWFAIPFASTSKACWQGANNPSNNGVIPGALFPAASCVNIVSPEALWGTTCYKIYVSSYKTSINYGMTFCN